MQDNNDNILKVLYKEPFCPPVVVDCTLKRLEKMLTEDGGKIEKMRFASDVEIIYANTGTLNFMCGFDWVKGPAAFVGKGRHEGVFVPLTQARINAIRYLFKWEDKDNAENTNIH